MTAPAITERDPLVTWDLFIRCVGAVYFAPLGGATERDRAADRRIHEVAVDHRRRIQAIPSSVRSASFDLNAPAALSVHVCRFMADGRMTKNAREAFADYFPCKVRGMLDGQPGIHFGDAS